MTKLAALHSLDAAGLDLPAFPTVTTVAEAVVAELDEWERVLAARGGTPDPALAFSLRWLRRPHPRLRRSARVGPGRHGAGELHVSRRESDRCRRLGAGSPRRPHGRHRLAVAAGDTGAVHRLPDAAARLRSAVGQRDRRGPGPLLPGDGRDQAPGDESPGPACRATSRRQRRNGDGGGNDVGNGFIYQVLHRRLWLEALAAANGLELVPAEEPQARDPARQRLDVRRRPHPAARRHRPPDDGSAGAGARKGVARIIKYLARVDAYGPYYEECELQDLAKLLGRRPGSRGERPGGRGGGGRCRKRLRRGLHPHRSGAGSPARPSWPVPPWVCSPTGTGRRSDEDGARDDRRLRRRPGPAAHRAHVPRARPGGRRLPRRGAHRPLVGDRDMLVLLERAGTQSRRLGVLPGPTQRQHLQRRRLGLGRPRRLPVGAGLPGRVLGPAAPARDPNGTCATSSGPTASVSGSWSR